MARRHFALIAALITAFVQTALGGTQPRDPSYRREAANARDFAAPPKVMVSGRRDVQVARAKAQVPDSDQIGLTFTLDSPLDVDVAVSSGPSVTAHEVHVAGAARLRAKLSTLVVPTDTVFWVMGADSAKWVAFDTTSAIDQSLWTPSIDGDTIRIVAESNSGGRLTYSISELADLRPTSTSTSCFRDATCYEEAQYPGMEYARSAVGQMEFIRGTGVYMCTGALLSDRADREIYFLTANHCISTPTAASSIEFTWDAYASSCGGSSRSTSSTLGAQLVATSASSDVTLLRPNRLPAGRSTLGWDPRPSSLIHGSRMFRVSHPATADSTTWYLQSVAVTTIDTTASTCTAASRPSYIYSRQAEGGVGPGSSGAPSFLSGGYIVGQLRGACGSNPEDACDRSNSIMDGSFAASWPVLAPFLDNDSAPPPSCQADGRTLCLNGSRFSLVVDWRTSDGKTGTGTAVPVTSDTGYFWFFGKENVELVVKVLDGRGVNGKFWVFYGALTNVEFTMTVRDVQTGRVRTYFNPNGTFASKGDTSAF